MATATTAKQRKRQAQPFTIPEWVEEQLGLKDGDSLVFLKEDGRIFLQRETSRPSSDARESVNAEFRDMTLDEIRANPLVITGPHSDDFDNEIEEAMQIETRRYLDRDRFSAP